MNISEARELVLEPGRKVRIQPIRRVKPYLKKGHDGEDIYTGCAKGFGLFYDADIRSYVNPFTKDKEAKEQEAFEKLLNKKEGDLNLYNFKVTEPNFWGSFKIKVPKGGVLLNLGNPSDALLYRIAKVDPKVANNSTERNIGSKVFEIVDTAVRKKEASELSRKKSKATDYMYKLKKSKRDMYNTLRLLDKFPTTDADKDWLEGELYKIIDEVAVAKGVAGLDKFLEVMEDATSPTKLFVLDAIAAGELVRDTKGYKIEDGNTFVGRKIPEVVEYFLSKDPKVIEKKTLIEERLK